MLKEGSVLILFSTLPVPYPSGSPAPWEKNSAFCFGPQILPGPCFDLSAGDPVREVEFDLCLSCETCYTLHFDPQDLETSFLKKEDGIQAQYLTLLSLLKVY